MKKPPAPNFLEAARRFKGKAKRLLNINPNLSHRERRFLRRVAKGKCPGGTEIEFHHAGRGAWQIQVRGACKLCLEVDV